MPLIMCTKFQINQIILTLFSGVGDKSPIPVAEKVVKCRRKRVKLRYNLIENLIILERKMERETEFRTSVGREFQS